MQIEAQRLKAQILQRQYYTEILAFFFFFFKFQVQRMLSRWQCELVGHCAQSCSCKSINTLLLVLCHMINASLITAHDETFFTGDNVQTSGTLKVKEKTKGWVKFGRASLYDVSGTAGAGGVFIHVIIEGSCAHPFVNSRLCCGDPDGGRWVRWPVQLHLSKAKYTFSNFFFYFLHT